MKYYLSKIEDICDAKPLPVRFKHKSSIAAEWCAEQENRKRSSNYWPIYITLVSDLGEELGTFEVDREMTPTFCAYLIPTE